MKVKDSLHGRMMMTSDASNKYSQTRILSKFLEQDIGFISRNAMIFCLRLYHFSKQSSKKFNDIHRIYFVIDRAQTIEREELIMFLNTILIVHVEHVV